MVSLDLVDVGLQRTVGQADINSILLCRWNTGNRHTCSSNWAGSIRGEKNSYITSKGWKASLQWVITNLDRRDEKIHSLLLRMCEVKKTKLAHRRLPKVTCMWVLLWDKETCSRTSDPIHSRTHMTTTTAHYACTPASTTCELEFLPFRKLNPGSKSLHLVRNQNGQSEEKTAVVQEREGEQTGTRVA